ncbi:MAG: ABC transporter ATP-binding protein [Micavibrio aeruginosavorus]|uniref:ABC transporter ATP-binding protein n=1 Tax=Micavibrio aeruginosavorus TaxID=349221 RepID=A0A2W5MUW4_9BACT|nr:MAG: ABC transporter ATP-binding protein [Micavibrio aeruginosavorus]
MSLVKFDIPDATQPLPTDFKGFLKYVTGKTPKLWALFFTQDFLHFTRYPIALILFGRVIDALGQRTPEQGIPHEAILYLLAIFAVLLLGELMHIWTAHIMIYWKPRMRAGIRSDFLQYTMGHSHSYFQDNFAGAIARKVSEVAESALRMHDIVRFQIFFGVSQLLVNLCYAFALNWRFGIAMACFVIAVTAPVIIRLPKIRARSLRFSEERAHVTGVVVDMLTNIPAIKFFSGLGHEIGVHAENAAKERKRSSKLMRAMIQIENLRRICLVILGAGMSAFSVYGWSQGWITVGEASSVTSLSLMLAGVTWMLGGGIVQFVDEAGYISDALRITARQHGISDKPESKRLIADKAKIEFDHVNFSFSDHTVFKDLNITLEGGEKAALVGPSGAGKSTLIAILMRLYDLQSGKILIDGQDIAQVTQNSLRDAIAVIPQDTALFHRTLMENIRYGRRDATDEEVMEAAKKAYAHDFIVGLSEGYNTLVGERGIRLSGGQRQRIAIARALLKNAPILILDEATSALDSESERLIQGALEELMKGKTVIAIAHRLSTIARMDRILVMERGEVVEQGSHAALLSKPGLYAKLWAMQSGGFLAEEGLDLSGENRAEIAIKTIDG